MRGTMHRQPIDWSKLIPIGGGGTAFTPRRIAVKVKSKYDEEMGGWITVCPVNDKHQLSANRERAYYCYSCGEDYDDDSGRPVHKRSGKGRPARSVKRK